MLERMTLLSLLPVRTSWSCEWLYRTPHTLWEDREAGSHPLVYQWVAPSRGRRAAQF